MKRLLFHEDAHFTIEIPGMVPSTEQKTSFSHPNLGSNPGSPLTSCVTLLFNHRVLISFSVNGDDIYRCAGPILRIKGEQVCKGQINVQGLPLGCANLRFTEVEPKTWSRFLGQIFLH